MPNPTEHLSAADRREAAIRAARTEADLWQLFLTKTIPTRAVAIEQLTTKIGLSEAKAKELVDAWEDRKDGGRL